MSLIDPVEDVAGMFFRNDEAEASGAVRSVTVRLTSERLAMVDAMAEYAECSRNVMANQLLKAGISAVLSQLPSEMVDEIKHDALERTEG